ncbi:putative quinol monooxygenase [Natronorubrum tibetense]|uniref:putative quinol monooxygenase n=1 Tax=Natronorubrum tibetense TaxID=63128 RepID=UPI0030845FCE
MRFFEQYVNTEAFEAHTQTTHSQEFEAALQDFLAGEPEVIQFDVIARPNSNSSNRISMAERTDRTRTVARWV